MLNVKFDPNTNVLIVETERTVKFKEKIVFGLWYPIKDVVGDTIFEIQVKEVGSEEYEFNVEGKDKEELNNLDEKYDISDILSYEKYKVGEFKKKCVLVEVKIQNGEREYYAKSLHIVGKDVDVRRLGERHAKKFYSRFAYEDDGTYYFDAGEVATQLYKAEEITREEYRILNKFL